MVAGPSSPPPHPKNYRAIKLFSDLPFRAISYCFYCCSRNLPPGPPGKLSRDSNRSCVSQFPNTENSHASSFHFFLFLLVRSSGTPPGTHSPNTPQTSDLTFCIHFFFWFCYFLRASNPHPRVWKCLLLGNLLHGILKLGCRHLKSSST